MVDHKCVFLETMELLTKNTDLYFKKKKKVVDFYAVLTVCFGFLIFSNERATDCDQTVDNVGHHQ